MTAPTGNVVIDSILWGGARWPGNLIRYHFSDAYYAWTDTEKQAYRAALQAWADVADLEFVEAASVYEASFVAYSVDNSTFGATVAGVHQTPDDAARQGGVAEGYFNWQAYGQPNGSGYNTSSLQPGGYAFNVMLHELGHGLGLAHPHDTGGGSPVMPGVSAPFDDYGDHDLNQGIFTVMSYNDGWDAVQDPFGNGLVAYGYAAGLSALDIAAIQYLYGANTSHNPGDNIYVIPEQGSWLSIWDTGGTDTIVYRGAGNAVIDLNSATLDNSPSGGGLPSHVRDAAGMRYYGGFTIAGDFTDALPDQDGETGVIIENAAGGSGNDRITGNGVANRLDGNGGDDTIRGGSGRDTVAGGSGQDTLFGDAGADVIDGGDGNDRARGGAGDDTIQGGGGNDALFGQNGADTVRGGSGGDTLQGNNGDDTLNGQSGNDMVKGGYNWDLVQGGGGNDTVNGQRGNDRVEGNDGDDRVIGEDGKDTLVGGAGRDTLLGGNGNDFLNGGGAGDTLEGGAGRDTLLGGAGDDVLIGGNGPDIFRFEGARGSGTDTIADFENGTDLIRIDGGVTFSDLTIDRTGPDTVIAWAQGAVTLAGETGLVDADDFLFG